MSLKRTLEKRRKDGRWIAGGLLLLLVLLTGLYYLLLSSRELPEELLNNRLLLFVLSYVNGVLILAICFVLARNLFKLAVERRHRLLGSKLKTKLVLTYVGLSLIPVILLFVYGSGLLRGWMDRWFDETAIREVAERGYALTQEMHRQVDEALDRNARTALRRIRDLDISDPGSGPDLELRLTELLGQLDVAFIEVYRGTDFVHGVLGPQSGLQSLPEPGRTLLIDVIQKGRGGRRISDSADGSARIVLRGAAGAEDDATIRTVVVVGTVLPAELASQMAEIIQTHQGLRQLDVQREEIQTGFSLLFLMVTLIILLAVTWVGLYLARRITQPIEALADATRHVAGGEIGYQVDVPADDELRVLVDSFNRMTRDLERNERLLEESHRELLRANESLAEERSLLSAVLQNSAAGVISVDAEGTVLTCNGAALHMLRLTEGEVVGRPAREAFGDPERSKLVDLFEGSEAVATETLRMVLAGSWRTFEARLTEMRGLESLPAGRVLVLEDLTELINAQQTAAWSEAARRVAHEIKNPLTPIQLTAERLLRKQQQGDPGLGQAIEEGAEIIRREVASMQAMVDEFSRFARMRRPQPDDVDMRRLLSETLGLYDGIKEGVTVDGSVEVDAETVRVDGEQVKQVLINLLDNAVSAVDPPGRVDVRVERDDGMVRFQVADTGRGISPEDRRKLFLPHFSTKGRGSGLGLAIVERIVAEHHGSVRVEDNEPHGTIFTIELPQG